MPAPAPVDDVLTGTQIRFMTAGSVDDGKSTLIGRLLLDSGALMRDQAATIGEDGAGLAELTDGLEAERAQGITIDVAYRYFSVPGTSFIIADAPGHEQYTRNMVTAASVSDVAMLVIDATGVINGRLKPQTRRHAIIAALMDLDIIVAVNKMDGVDWSQERFEEVRKAVTELAETLGVGQIACVPISARTGANVVRRGEAGWWAGPTLIDLIRRTQRGSISAGAHVRLPVQTLLRDGPRRLYAGRIEAGQLKPGDAVVVGPSRQPARIAQILVGNQAVASASAGAAIAVALEEDRDLTRGDVIADPQVRYARDVVVDLCWLDDEPWAKGRRYWLRQGTLETQTLITGIESVLDVESGARHPATALKLNDIARVVLSARDVLLADAHKDLPITGAVILIDPDSNQTCAAGLIREIAS